ncbi:MAG: hypothetical protein KA413_00240 [Candidatus Methylopumilus sp.]|nr:hypothetical protein [Candidatus Methylopumilus sp.]
MKFISINAENETMLVNTASILFLEHKKDRTVIHLVNGSLIYTAESIDELGKRLAKLSDKF